MSEMDIESQNAVEALGILDRVDRTKVVNVESYPAFLVSQGIDRKEADSYLEIWQAARGG